MENGPNCRLRIVHGCLAFCDISVQHYSRINRLHKTFSHFYKRDWPGTSSTSLGLLDNSHNVLDNRLTTKSDLFHPITCSPFRSRFPHFGTSHSRYHDTKDSKKLESFRFRFGFPPGGIFPIGWFCLNTISCIPPPDGGGKHSPVVGCALGMFDVLCK